MVPPSSIRFRWLAPDYQYQVHCGPVNVFYFIVSGEISVYLMEIKVVSITSELISYHFTIVNDTIYIFTLHFG